MERTDSLVGELSIWGEGRQEKDEGVDEKKVEKGLVLGEGCGVEGWSWVRSFASGDVARESREALAGDLGP